MARAMQRVIHGVDTLCVLHSILDWLVLGLEYVNII